MGPGNATRDRAPLPTNPAELLPLGAAFDEVLDAGLPGAVGEVPEAAALQLAWAVATRPA